jgi:CubicO group peptidase (beta-lactamase class C family)
MRKHRGLLPALAIVAATLPVPAMLGCSSGNPAPPGYASTIAEMSSRIDGYMRAAGTTGLSIVLVDGDRVAWTTGFGLADAGVPVTADTIFEIGSLSKTFAAATVMQLVEEGRMRLDDPLSLHVPAFSIQQRFPESGPITLRSILTHHSGIPGDLFNGTFTEGHPFDYEAWLLADLANEHTAAPVGAVLAYSNSAMALLRPAIDAAAPEGFAARSFALFDALGMSSTSYALDGRIPLDRLSRGFEDGAPLPLLFGNLSTAGTIRSSASDMARYVRMIHGGGVVDGRRVLAASSLDEMFRRQNRDVPLDFDQGVGLAWFTGPDDDYAGRRVEHSGQSPWFVSRIEILLDHHLGVVVLSNTLGIDVERIARETLELALREKSGIAPPAPPAPAYSPPDPTWTAERLQAVAGTYVVTGGLGFRTMEVRATEGGLLVDGGPNTWIPRQNGYFSFADGVPDAQARQYRFHRVEGRDVSSALLGGQRYLLGERYVQGEIPAAWRARAGRYEATNVAPGGALWPGTNTLTISIDDAGILRLGETLRGSIAVTAVSDRLGFVGGLGRNRGESVRVVDVDGEEQVELWGFRYRKTP